MIEKLPIALFSEVEPDKFKLNAGKSYIKCFDLSNQCCLFALTIKQSFRCHQKFLSLNITLNFVSYFCQFLMI